MSTPPDAAQAPDAWRDEERRGNRRMRLVLLGALALLLALGLGLRALIGGKPERPRPSVARISVLPDTPPPPPPPKTEKPPEPPPDQRPQPRELPDKPQDAPKPAEAPIKMEGTAGDGPSAFQSGAVTSDYKGGATGPGGGASAPVAVTTPGVAPAADRAQERFYAAAARQQLRDELDRRLQQPPPGDASPWVAQFSLWVARDGAIQRLELQPSGNPQADAELRAALDDTQRQLRLAPPPAAMAQPLRFRLTLKPTG